MSSNVCQALSWGSWATPVRVYVVLVLIGVAATLQYVSTKKSFGAAIGVSAGMLLFGFLYGPLLMQWASKKKELYGWLLLFLPLVLMLVGAMISMLTGQRLTM